MFRLFRFLRPYSGSIALITVLVLAQSLIDLALPTLMAEIVNLGVIKNDIPFILRTGGFMLAIALLGVICALASGFLSSRTSLGFSAKLRHLIFERAGRFSLYEYDRIGASSLITRTTNDVLQVQQTLIIMLSMMLRAPLMSVGGIIMAVTRDAKLSLVLAAFLPVLAGLIWIVQRTAMPLFRDMQDKLDDLNLVIREKLSGVREVRAFDMAKREERRFDAASGGLTDIALKLANLMSSTMPFVMLVMNLSIIAIIWFGGIRVSSGKMSLGDILAFVQYVNLILFSIMMISILFILLPRSEVSAARINEVLVMEPSVKDPSSPVSPAPSGRLEFRDVTFKYHGAQDPAICGVSFSAVPGGFTGIIGSTGSGKSTLASLALRFYDVCEGRVLVDGEDVRAMRQEDLRRRIGYVPQRSFLFTGTIADNVSFGSGAETGPAIEVSQSSEFVSSMEAGELSAVSQGGRNLSGGQRQRLSIARAIARKPSIYIFDDAFSALDYKTDAALRSALRERTTGSTVVIISQRVATVLDADRIVVMDDGTVAGTGTHAELMETCAVYREIVNSQLAPEASV